MREPNQVTLPRLLAMPFASAQARDRGELDKIIEKSAPGSVTRDEDDYRSEKKDYDSYKDQNDPNYRRKKKGGFLSDLFDFDDLALSIGISLGLTLGFLAICVAVIAVIFRTGWRLRT